MAVVLLLVLAAAGWLVVSLLITAVACALCRAGRLEDIHWGYDR